MRRMEGAMVRAIRMNRSEKKYFVGMVGDNVLTTYSSLTALNFTSMNDNQINFLMDKLIKKGYTQAHLVTYGVFVEDEYGGGVMYEKPHQRASMEDLMDLVDDDYYELIGEDE